MTNEMKIPVVRIARWKPNGLYLLFCASSLIIAVLLSRSMLNTMNQKFGAYELKDELITLIPYIAMLETRASIIPIMFIVIFSLSAILLYFLIRGFTSYIYLKLLVVKKKRFNIHYVSCVFDNSNDNIISIININRLVYLYIDYNCEIIENLSHNDVAFLVLE
jgi:hypothetical protein